MTMRRQVLSVLYLYGSFLRLELKLDAHVMRPVRVLSACV